VSSRLGQPLLSPAAGIAEIPHPSAQYKAGLACIRPSSGRHHKRRRSDARLGKSVGYNPQFDPRGCVMGHAQRGSVAIGLPLACLLVAGCGGASPLNAAAAPDRLALKLGCDQFDTQVVPPDPGWHVLGSGECRLGASVDNINLYDFASARDESAMVSDLQSHPLLGGSPGDSGTHAIQGDGWVITVYDPTPDGEIVQLVMDRAGGQLIY
jgi:hypothetical protein